MARGWVVEARATGGEVVCGGGGRGVFEKVYDVVVKWSAREADDHR